MDVIETSPKKNRRRSERIEAPDLFVSVKRKRWLVFEEYIDVETLDVNRGGVGIIASDLKLKLLENVRLHFDFDGEEYFISGIVVYQNSREGLEFYGIMYTQLPHQFEDLLGRLLAEAALDDREDDVLQMEDLQKTQKIDIADIIKSKQIRRAKRIGNAAISKAKNATRQIKAIAKSNKEKLESVSTELSKLDTIPDTQRRIDPRYPAQLLGVRIRSRGLASFVDFIKTDATDVSLGGISLSTKTSVSRLGEKVRLELKYKNMVLRASGLITYFCEKDGQYHYGVQFTMVPMKMRSLIRIMQASEDRSNQAAAK